MFTFIVIYLLTHTISYQNFNWKFHPDRWLISKTVAFAITYFFPNSSTDYPLKSSISLRFFFLLCEHDPVPLTEMIILVLPLFL